MANFHCCSTIVGVYDGWRLVNVIIIISKMWMFWTTNGTIVLCIFVFVFVLFWYLFFSFWCSFAFDLIYFIRVLIYQFTANSMFVCVKQQIFPFQWDWWWIGESLIFVLFLFHFYAIQMNHWITSSISIYFLHPLTIYININIYYDYKSWETYTHSGFN